MSIRTTAACCLIVLAGIAAPPAASAQTGSDDLQIAIPETVWGFDGKAVRESFMPLSILVRNMSAKTASGSLRLVRQIQLDRLQEPPIDIPFDIPPFEERWLQVAPYVVDEFAPWEIIWGKKASERVEIPQPRLGPPATVLLHNPNDRARATGLLRRFSANLFPASVTSTDALETVFLDSIPDLQGARLQAFLEWLRRGGRVILLHGDDQNFPKFPPALAVLNDPAETFLVGNGEVRRLPLDASRVDNKQLRLAARPERREAVQPEVAAAFRDPYRTYQNRVPWNRDRAVLEKLEGVAQFHRRWWLIYPLALIYLLAIFPGSYAIAQTTKGVRRFYITYFAVTALFAWGFKTLGGVGGGDENRIRSATVACQLSPGVYDCSQWSCMAAVNGGWFAFSHEGSGRWYCHNEEFETPHGLITTGAAAKYEVDIPVASTRSVVSRFRAVAPPVQAELRSADFVDGKLNNCSVAFAGLPADPVSALICHREKILVLQRNGDIWSADLRRSMTTSVFISDLTRVTTATLNRPRGRQIANQVSTDFYKSLERSLIGNAFEIRGHVESWSGVLPPGRVRVLALVEDGRAFAGTSADFGDVQGCVLYVVDLPINED